MSSDQDGSFPNLGDIGDISDMNEQISRFRTKGFVQVNNHWLNNAKNATYAWVIFCSVYWSCLVIIPAVFNNDLNSYEYYLWIFGMIGICSVYYAVKAEQAADSPAGKPLMAMTCLVMFTDMIAHAGVSSLTGESLGVWGVLLVLCHALAILWATLFFYNRAIKHGKKLAWLTLLIEWTDIIFMCIALFILKRTVDDCMSEIVCVGYGIVLVLQVMLWFFPIMFGYSDTEFYIHVHMVIVDSFTDLPLLAIIIIGGGYKIHWFIAIDTGFKLILLLRSYAFHLFLNLCLRRKELQLLQTHQEEELALEEELLDEGIEDEEIDKRLEDMIEKHQTIMIEEKARWEQ